MPHTEVLKFHVFEWATPPPPAADTHGGLQLLATPIHCVCLVADWFSLTVEEVQGDACSTRSLPIPSIPALILQRAPQSQSQWPLLTQTLNQRPSLPGVRASCHVCPWAGTHWAGYPGVHSHPWSLYFSVDSTRLPRHSGCDHFPGPSTSAGSVQSPCSSSFTVSTPFPGSASFAGSMLYTPVCCQSLSSCYCISV